LKNISLIIPCYNEEFRFPQKEFSDFHATSEGVTFYFINDGSSDDTGILLDSLFENINNIHVIHLIKNIGKAEAIRKGVLYALEHKESDFIGYFDADLATPLEQLLLFQEALSKQLNRKVIFGSRIKKAGSTIIRDSFRHYSGRIIATLINKFILEVSIYDTQCGAKLIATPLAEEIFRAPFISRWLFDVELIGRLQNKYNKEELGTMIYEVPLTSWEEKGNTKIRFVDIFMIPIELIKIYKKY
jgi:dolichyl-phosphate beta-glucosyltransferase